MSKKNKVILALALSVQCASAHNGTFDLSVEERVLAAVVTDTIGKPPKLDRKPVQSFVINPFAAYGAPPAVPSFVEDENVLSSTPPVLPKKIVRSAALNPFAAYGAPPAVPSFLDISEDDKDLPSPLPTPAVSDSDSDAGQ